MKRTFTFYTLLLLAFATRAQDYSSWITDDWKILKDKGLKEIVLPGSHDAGMSVLTYGTTFSDSCNTQTQVFSIADQLKAGVRYFDLRPVFYNDNVNGNNVFQWYTGHFDETYVSGIQGSIGEPLDSALQAVADFLETHREPVILEFSHYFFGYPQLGVFWLYDVDFDQVFNLEYVNDQSEVPFSFGQGGNAYYSLPHKIRQYLPQNLRISGDKDSILITELQHLLPDSTGKALIIIDDPKSDTLPDGMYADSSLTIYNSWSDTILTPAMIIDQFNKFNDNWEPDSTNHLQLVSWTVSLGTITSTFCSNSILSYADEANGLLYDSMTEWFDADSIRPGKIPNIILTDSSTSFTTATSIQLNQLLHKQDSIDLHELHSNPKGFHKTTSDSTLNDYPFIEMVNNHTDTIDLDGWTVEVNNTNVHSFSGETKLLPGQALVITENLNNDYDIPECAKVVEVSSGSFNFTQASDDLVIYNNEGRAVDRYRYQLSDTSNYNSFARPYGAPTFNHHVSIGTGNASPGLDEQQLPYLDNCSILSIQTVSNKFSFSIKLYPNPASSGSSITLSIPGNDQDNYHVELFSIDGSLQQQRTLSGKTQTLDLDGITQGVYLVRVSNQQFVINKKLIVRD